MRAGNLARPPLKRIRVKYESSETNQVQNHSLVMEGLVESLPPFPPFQREESWASHSRPSNTIPPCNTRREIGNVSEINKQTHMLKTYTREEVLTFANVHTAIEKLSYRYPHVMEVHTHLHSFSSSMSLPRSSLMSFGVKSFGEKYCRRLSSTSEDVTAGHVLQISWKEKSDNDKKYKKYVTEVSDMYVVFFTTGTRSLICLRPKGGRGTFTPDVVRVPRE